MLLLFLRQLQLLDTSPTTCSLFLYSDGFAGSRQYCSNLPQGRSISLTFSPASTRLYQAGLDSGLDSLSSVEYTSAKTYSMTAACSGV